MLAWLKIVRPLNCLMVVIGVGCGALVTVGINFTWVIIPAFLTSFFIAGAGNVLNDYYDREPDKVSHPERAIPSGKLKPKAVLNFAVFLFALGLVFGALTFSWLAVAIALCAVGLLVAYEHWLKRKGLEGNLVISVLVGLVFLFGSATVSLSLNSLKPVLILAGLAFLATLARELVKDIEDIKGDSYSRKTLPLKIGTKKAEIASSTLLIGAILLSPLPWLAKLFNELYLGIIALADAILVYSIFILPASPGLASKSIKLAMLIALLGFILAALLR